MGSFVKTSASPRVSVVIAAYNVAPFIAEAVRSALAQTYGDFELIVVDDGSMDRTAEIVESIQDPRLRLIRLPHGSATIAVNTALATARGEYLGFLDGDDRWLPTKLEKHVAFMDAHPEVELTFSWSRIVDESGADTGNRAQRWTGPISFPELLVDNVIANGSAVVLRTEVFRAVGMYDTGLRGCYDLDCWLRIALRKPGNLHAIPEELTDYRRRAGQMTRNTRLMEQEWLAVINKIVRMEPEKTARGAPIARVNLYRFLSYVNYEQGDMAEAHRCLRLSFSNQPGRFLADYRNWGLLAILASAAVLPRKLQQGLVRQGIRCVSALRSQLGT
jgi:glycosyltransferase involved in cell wall biosynthesis